MSIGRRSKAQVAVSRPIVYKRDGRCCVVDGLFEAVRWPCAGGLTVQHRRGKGMGGSALGDDPKALISFCHFHNLLETADADFAKACIQNGWAVPRWVADQHNFNKIPVKYCDGWYLLDGSERFLIPEHTALDMMADIYGSLFDS